MTRWYLENCTHRRCINMKYEIKNHKGVYININSNGKPVTCSKEEKGLFEFSKAKNIVNSLPKTLKKLKFKVEAVPDIEIQKDKDNKKTGKITKRQKYMPSENITRWIEKFGTCSDIFNEAKQRANLICKELYDSDKELIDILHIIEIEPPKDLYGGWIMYKKIKKNREDRRKLKDELLIVENVLKGINPSCLERKNIKKAVDGLLNREYRFRIIEEEQKNVM